MSDPRRLHEAPETELERSLLDAGRGYRASATTRARALAALGVAGATAATSTAAAGSKWASSLFLMAGLAVPAALYLRAVAAPPPSVSLHATARPSASTIAPHPSPAPELPLAPMAEVESPSVAPRKEPRATASVPLSAELAALDAARSALGRGDASNALTSLDAYSRAFPSGKLRLEAEVLRITALARTGHSAAADERARAFLRRHPDSLLAPRVRAYLTP